MKKQYDSIHFTHDTVIYVPCYQKNPKKVGDGDTIDVDIDLGFGVWKRNIRLRLNRIDAYETRLGRGTTPEMKALGLEGKALVQKVIDEHGGVVQIRTTKKGKYGRYIAEVNATRTNISDMLVTAGYAVYKFY